MSFVVCGVPVSPLRKEASHRSEMVSQLLFGEWAEVLERSGSFSYVRCKYDGYEGWCQANQLHETGMQQGRNSHLLTAGWINSIDSNNAPLQVSLGTPLDIFTGTSAVLGKFHYHYKGKVWNAAAAIFDETNIREVSALFLNTAYLWGGRSVFGIDCSGFTQQVFRFFNKSLRRDASQQAISGDVVGFLQEARCGDLAFFDNEEGHITHVGIMLGPDTIIHASGKVRIDRIDHMGILSSDTGERTHKLRMVKRVGESS